MQNSLAQSNRGGGIYNDGSGGSASLTILNSTVSGNSAYSAGGAIYNDSGNAGSATLTIRNSTIDNNLSVHTLPFHGGAGGGVIKNSTISGNDNGGISTQAMEIGNTILDGNTGANIDGTATSLGYNISSDDGGGNLTGPGDQINTAPLIGPLQDNGGPTLTHALLPGSPAINAGDPNFTPPPFSDQGGSPSVRVFNGRIDIGAFEVQPLHHITPEPRSRPTPVPRRMP